MTQMPTSWSGSWESSGLLPELLTAAAPLQLLVLGPLLLDSMLLLGSVVDDSIWRELHVHHVRKLPDYFKLSFMLLWTNYHILGSFCQLLTFALELFEQGKFWKQPIFTKNFIAEFNSTLEISQILHPSKNFHRTRITWYTVFQKLCWQIELISNWSVWMDSVMFSFKSSSWLKFYNPAKSNFLQIFVLMVSSCSCNRSCVAFSVLVQWE